jgi:hypothetical protein
MSEYLSINALHERLPTGSQPDVLWRARQAGAMPNPDVQLSIVITGRAKAVPAWEATRAERWLDQVTDQTDGKPLRFRDLRWLVLDREPWWEVNTEQLATAADIRAVCPTVTKESLRYRLRAPGGWWHSEAVAVGNRTGWRLPVARRIIDELALPLDLTRWAHLTALAAGGALGPLAADREAHLAALTAA